jgi:lipoprotein-releasing system permease protein
VIIGSRLADELAVDVGERLILRAVRPASGSAAASAEAVVVVRGIFTLGVQAIDERVLYIELGTAKKLFDIQDGVSIIELKVDDVWQAPALADRLARATQLKASSWLERNARLQEGLRAQASTAAMIKVFSLLTIAIGVASTLYLSVSRRRSEIGILRSFGIGRAAIIRAFVLQGVLVGAMGATTGIALGFGFAHVLLAVSMKANGVPSIPIDPDLGEYGWAVILAVGASAFAAVLPAWSAAKIDPLEAIQS